MKNNYNEDIDISMSEYDIKEKYRLNKKIIKKINIIININIILFLILIIIYSLYLYFTSKKENLIYDGLKGFLVENVSNLFDLIIGEKEYDLDFSNINNKNFSNKVRNLEEFLGSNLTIFEKRNILKNELTKLIEKFENIKSEIDKLEKDFGKYAFLPKEIDNIMYDGNMYDIILSVEAIKGSSYFSVYSNLGSFIDRFASIIGDTQTNTKEYFDNLKKGHIEKYFKDYLNMCYLNIFENDYKTCSFSKDFDFYYNNFSDKKPGINFKLLAYYIYETLDNQKIKNIDIVFNNLNHKNNEIGFNVEINTFYDDKSSIISDRNNFFGKIDTHMYIITVFINSIRQSNFILGKDINIEKINVNKIEKENIIADSSNFDFTVKLQPEIVKEIYDFKNK